MELLTINHVTLQVGESVLLKEATMRLHERDVVGIVGRNGAGKTTLLQLLAGELQQVEGHMHWRRHVSMTHVLQEAEHVHTPHTALHKKWHVPNIPYAQLSGGQKLKHRLVDGFLAKSDVLLLDEPTNHLDDKSLQRLIKEVRLYKGTVIIVSHDRYFLDEVATKIWSIEEQALFEHSGNYTSYEAARKARRHAQQQAYKKQQQQIEAIEQQLTNLSMWSHRAHRDSTHNEGFKEYYRKSAQRMDNQVKSKRKRLKKELATNTVEQVVDEESIYFTLQATKRSGKRLFLLDNVSKRYGDKTVLTNVNAQIVQQQRIAITGANGSGKTTLLRLLLQREEPTTGTVWRSQAATIGYLSQNVFTLEEQATPSALFEKHTFQERGDMQTLLHQLGFHHTQWTQPIVQMSMGERVKLKLVQHIVEKTACLLLDEPTNHLDLPSREQFEEALALYTGTLLVVSHDRYFRERITDTTWELTQKTLVLPHAAEQKSEAERLQLETKRQFVLGKLSMLSKDDAAYEELDRQFNELTMQLQQLQ